MGKDPFSSSRMFLLKDGRSIGGGGRRMVVTKIESLLLALRIIGVENFLQIKSTWLLFNTTKFYSKMV